MIYIIFISIRFYGLKNWINEVINDPVYFLFPLLTSLSFYEKSKLNDQETHDKKEKLSALEQAISRLCNCCNYYFTVETTIISSQESRQTLSIEGLI